MCLSASWIFELIQLYCDLLCEFVAGIRTILVDELVSERQNFASPPSGGAVSGMDVCKLWMRK